VNDVYAEDRALAEEASDTAAGYVYDHVLDGHEDGGSVIDTVALVLSLVLAVLLCTGRIPL
jgi:hypothetical protein